MMTTDIIEIDEEMSVGSTLESLRDEFDHMVQTVLGVSRNLVATGILTGFLFITALPTAASEALQYAAPLEIVVDNSGAQLELRDAVQFLKHHSRLYNDLDMLRNLKTGWDGYSAQAPSGEALSDACSIINLLDEKILAHCAVFPSNDKGVYLQGRFASGRMSVFLNGESMTVALSRKTDEKYLVSQDICEQNIKLLKKKINELLSDEEL